MTSPITDLEAKKLAEEVESELQQLRALRYKPKEFVMSGETAEQLARKVLELLKRHRWLELGSIGSQNAVSYQRNTVSKQRRDGQWFIFQLPPLPQPPEQKP